MLGIEAFCEPLTYTKRTPMMRLMDMEEPARVMRESFEGTMADSMSSPLDPRAASIRSKLAPTLPMAHATPEASTLVDPLGASGGASENSLLVERTIPHVVHVNVQQPVVGFLPAESPRADECSSAPVSREAHLTFSPDSSGMGGQGNAVKSNLEFSQVRVLHVERGVHDRYPRYFRALTSAGELLSASTAALPHTARPQRTDSGSVGIYLTRDADGRGYQWCSAMGSNSHTPPCKAQDIGTPSSQPQQQWPHSFCYSQQQLPRVSQPPAPILWKLSTLSTNDPEYKSSAAAHPVLINGPSAFEGQRAEFKNCGAMQAQVANQSAFPCGNGAWGSVALGELVPGSHLWNFQPHATAIHMLPPSAAQQPPLLGMVNSSLQQWHNPPMTNPAVNTYPMNQCAQPLYCPAFASSSSHFAPATIRLPQASAVHHGFHTAHEYFHAPQPCCPAPMRLVPVCVPPIHGNENDPMSLKPPTAYSYVPVAIPLPQSHACHTSVADFCSYIAGMGPTVPSLAKYLSPAKARQIDEWMTGMGL